jgi:hypothetical protein
VRVNVFEAMFALPAASFATPAANDTLTVPCPEGVIDAV